MLLQVSFPAPHPVACCSNSLEDFPPCMHVHILHFIMLTSCHDSCHNHCCMQETCHNQTALAQPKTHSKKQALWQRLLAKKPLAWTQILALPLAVVVALHPPLTMPAPLLGHSKEAQAPVLQMLMQCQSSSSSNSALQVAL